MKRNPRKTKYWLPRLLAMALSTIMILFALVSGSEGFGGGIKGIITNSPNALPWLIFLIITVIAWRKEKMGALLFIIMSAGLAIFFQIWVNPGVLIILLPFVVVGFLFWITAKNPSR